LGFGYHHFFNSYKNSVASIIQKSDEVDEEDAKTPAIDG